MIVICIMPATETALIVFPVTPAYVFNLEAVVFLKVPPAPSSIKNKSASTTAAPMSVAPVNTAVANFAVVI